MVKKMILFRATAQENYSAFSDRILAIGHSLASHENTKAVKVTLTDTPPPSISIIPFKKKKVAVISVYNDQDAINIEQPEAAGVYDVEEAIPVGYQKDWENMQPTPGVCLFTLFRKKPGISWNTFLDRWHNSHTPLSLKIHPLWNYNRNVVLETEKEESEGWDGIVEEQFKSKSDLLNPIKFFGHPAIMPYRMP